MNRIRVAAATLNQTPLDWAGNQRRIAEAIDMARSQGVRILCLPELSITGYGCEDQFYSPGLHDTAQAVLQELLPATRGMVVSFGLPVFHRSALFNCAALVCDGRLLGLAAKHYLAAEGIHYEPRWFKPWPRGMRDAVEIGGREVPLGSFLYECGGVKIGFEICEDAWAARRPAGDMSPAGVDVILNPSASHFAFGKSEIRKRLVLEGSRAFNVSYVYANLLGNEAGRVIYDGGSLIASGGRLLAAGPRFSFRPVHVTSAVIDVQSTRMKYAWTGNFLGNADHSGVEEIACPFDWPDIEPEAANLAGAEWETGGRLKEEEFLRAETLGLFDYLRKSRAEGFVVSASGGADSSACACLVALMVELAVAELGEERFADALGHVSGLASARTNGERVGRLLWMVYQASAHSGEVTRHAAESLARALGARWGHFRIDALVDEYVRLIEGALDRKLTWASDDIALQNIQARVRGPSVWLLANVTRSLLLTTSNRSEAAVGYATMDGDTCGSLAPIAGIDKAYLRQWLRWLETEGPRGARPIAALAAVNAQQPTAELRPQESHQTDEDDLMPYPVLDAIERSAIRDKQPPREVFRILRSQFPEYSAEAMHGWVRRFFGLWCRNQWKRERYAPSFHLDDESLDPKTWCRFPILSGNFQRELEELRAYVAEREAGPPGLPKSF